MSVEYYIQLVLADENNGAFISAEHFQCVSNTDERVCGKRDDVLLLSHSEIWSDV